MIATGPTMSRIANDLAVQDNCCTAEPIFSVQQRRRITGIDPHYAESDHIVWLVDGEELHDDQVRELEDNYRRTLEIPDGYTRSAYVEIWEFVTACFTRAGCERYLQLNGHNLEQPRIYVYSANRNEEWQAVRKHLFKQASV